MDTHAIWFASKIVRNRSVFKLFQKSLHVDILLNVTVAKKITHFMFVKTHAIECCHVDINAKTYAKIFAQVYHYVLKNALKGLNAGINAKENAGTSVKNLVQSFVGKLYHVDRSAERCVKNHVKILFIVRRNA